MTGLPFTKMHGLGNDFVVLDGRADPLRLDAARIRAIAERRAGVGCDQVIILGSPRNGEADAAMTIYNADGGEVEACGNGTRCVAAMLMGETGRDRAVVETAAGLLDARADGAGGIAVDMGLARLDWRGIPLAEARDTLHLAVSAGPFADPVGVSIGNPHAVFFVDDAEAAPIEAHGPAIEHHSLFPQRINVEAAQVRRDGTIRLRVWERGVGITRACGTGACATLVAAHRRGLSGRRATVILDGGPLVIEWRDDGHVVMTGPAAISFSGTLDESLLAASP